MKVIVTEAFFDKNTGEAYNRGDIYEGDKDRVAELRDGGFLASVSIKKMAPAENGASGKTDGAAENPDNKNPEQ